MRKVKNSGSTALPVAGTQHEPVLEAHVGPAGLVPGSASIRPDRLIDECHGFKASVHFDD